MEQTPLDFVSAHPWQKAVFTTYSLSLAFVEAVILDALVRGGGHEALILADVEGVRAALMEQGARRAGIYYQVEPVLVQNGVFHPKITALINGAEAHVIVGSGNLTFGGWGGNLEVFEHLHPSFAPDAIEDVAEFFEYLSIADPVKHCSSDRCVALAEELRASVQGRRRNGEIRMLHNLGRGILEQLGQFAKELGGATQLVAVAPFWDGGVAIDRMCDVLGLENVLVHAHPGGTVEGRAGSNWPFNAMRHVRAIQLDFLEEPKPRRLHGKIFEVLCRRGRILVSGSANATRAALANLNDANDGRRNVETCVVRIQRDRLTGWTWSPTEVPVASVPADDDPDSDNVNVGVLRAVLAGDRIDGQVLMPRMPGLATVYQLTNDGPRILGEARIDAEGAFSLHAPGLEIASWKGGRLVIRVEGSSGKAAEGFMSIDAMTEIVRRAGLLAPRLLAVLAGTETPADVAAIMSWFHEHPSHLAAALPAGLFSEGAEKQLGSDPSVMIPVSELSAEFGVHPHFHGMERTEHGSGWRRFMECVFAAFRERRGSFTAAHTGGDVEDEADVPDDEGEDDSQDPAIERSLNIFERLLDQLLTTESGSSFVMVAFDLAQYVAERLRPDAFIVRRWTERLIVAALRSGVSAERRDDVAAAILCLADTTIASENSRKTRDRLLRLGADLNGGPPSSERVQGFASVLTNSSSFEDAWARVREIRTYSELVRSYLAALEGGLPVDDFGDLARAVPSEWLKLEKALTSEKESKSILIINHRLESCPRCHIVHPRIELNKLWHFHCATALNCCHRVILFVEAV